MQMMVMMRVTKLFGGYGESGEIINCTFCFRIFANILFVLQHFKLFVV